MVCGGGCHYSSYLSPVLLDIPPLSLNTFWIMLEHFQKAQLERSQPLLQLLQYPHSTYKHLPIKYIPEKLGTNLNWKGPSSMGSFLCRHSFTTSHYFTFLHISTWYACKKILEHLNKADLGSLGHVHCSRNILA